MFGDSWGGWVESASAKLRMGLWPVRSRDKVPERIGSIESNQDLGGGFQLFLCSPLFGEMIQFDYIIFFGFNHQQEDAIRLLTPGY